MGPPLQLFNQQSSTNFTAATNSNSTAGCCSWTAIIGDGFAAFLPGCCYYFNGLSCCSDYSNDLNCCLNR